MKVRKKEIAGDAIQYTGDSASEIIDIIELIDSDGYVVFMHTHGPKLTIVNFGINNYPDKTIDIGDWVVKDLDGEPHIYEQHIFNATYEKVEDDC